jgi:hypothetical protein
MKHYTLGDKKQRKRIPDISEALERDRKLGKFDIKPETTKEPAEKPTIITPKQGMIYLPSLNLNFAKQRTHTGLNWYDTHKELHKINQRMPTIPELIAYIKFLQTDYQTVDKQEADSILDDILTVKSPWRAEWLDADFKVKNKQLYINYNHYTDSAGNLLPKNTEKLEACLMTDKLPGIDLQDWLDNPTSQGLPRPNINEGSLFYWYPRSDNISVARFYAGSDRAFLGCNRNPRALDASLGVFACAEGACA